MHSFKQSIAGLVSRMANRYSSNPDKEKIHHSLTQLYESILQNPGKKGPVIKFNAQNDRFIILSDQHKGAKNLADDFAICEKNYLAALQFYHEKGFKYIALGDCEELWENSLDQVIKNNQPSFDAEKLFVANSAYVRVFGNHDLFWDNAFTARYQLRKIYGREVRVYEGLVLQSEVDGKRIELFLTHGHQGDMMSDGNAFSKWFVSNVWARVQAYLKINPNTPANYESLKTQHNKMMYEWSAQHPNLLMVTGHTHQPVFESLTHLERLYRQLNAATANNDAELQNQLNTEIDKRRIKGDIVPEFSAYQPCYFNSGCCCFNDGDITGIELENGLIRLIKWKLDPLPVRIILEEVEMIECINL